MRNTLKRTLAISLCVFSLGLCGCMKEKKIASAELSKNYQKSAQTFGEITQELIASISNFTFTLFKNTLNGQSSATLSPLSAYVCLSLLLNGSSGETQAQIENALGLQTHELNPAMQAYLSTLKSDKNCTFTTSNSIWFKQDDLEILPAFLQTNADYFGAQAYASPFDETTVQDINHWCYNKTGGKIDKILDSIPNGALMYAINTLDFDGKWQTPYQTQDIQSGIFHTESGEAQEAIMLHSTENTYFNSEKAIGFSRPYAGNAYSFTAFLPKENESVSSLIQSLSYSVWKDITNGETGTVYVQIPEFTTETEMDLSYALQTLGVQDLFDSTKADLRNISVKQALYCSAVKQKVKIEVNRKGTKAAAVTWGEMKTTSLPHGEIYITLDRPFLYAIVENRTNLPVFLGVCNRI